MGGLVVHVPIKTDKVVSYLGVEAGWDVVVKDSGYEAKIQREAEVKVSGNKAKIQRNADPSTCKWWVKYYNDQREERLERNKFTVKEYPVKLFNDVLKGDSESSSYFPVRDDHFETAMSIIDAYGHNFSLEELKEKAKCYYRAIGRVMLHILVDSEYTLSSTVMPELLRNGK